MKRILLISTIFNPETGMSDQHYDIMNPYGKKALMTPLNLATLAALTPDDIEVTLWDELVQGRIDDSTDLEDYDLVGISTYTPHIPRSIKVAQIFQKRGIPVAIGGPGASAFPVHCRNFFDILFIGEAELTWPQFIADWKTGSYRDEYRQVAKPDLAISPAPRWDGINVEDYLLGTVQTTRGCPFDCEFCDVIYLYSRRPRHKPIPQVLEEVSTLHRLGIKRSILFSDDNFTGDQRYAKDLLRALIPLNRTFPKPLGFQTQLSIGIAKDDELLDLLADANFGPLFIGIESPNKENLKEANKYENYRTDLLADIKKIQSYGMNIQAGMIVGFDHDTPETFDEQFEFLQEACIPISSIRVLTAPVGTRLWARLYKEGRITVPDSISTLSNITPLNMTRAELFTGYYDLVARNRSWKNFSERVKGFISGVKRRPNMISEGISDEDGGKGQKAVRNILRSIDDEEARGYILDILAYTRQHAPFMLKKVIGLVLRQNGRISTLPVLRESINQQIEIEASRGLIALPQVEFLVPDGFKEPYKEIFPEIHKHVYLNLRDKTCTDEALIEVFTDFLLRWGQTFEKFADYHRTFLFEIADRTIAKRNSIQSAVVERSQEEIPDIQKTRLADEVIKSVEQELRGIRFVSSDDQMNGVKRVLSDSGSDEYHQQP